MGLRFHRHQRSAIAELRVLLVATPALLVSFRCVTIAPRNRNEMSDNYENVFYCFCLLLLIWALACVIYDRQK